METLLICGILSCVFDVFFCSLFLDFVHVKQHLHCISLSRWSSEWHPTPLALMEKCQWSASCPCHQGLWSLETARSIGQQDPCVILAAGVSPLAESHCDSWFGLTRVWTHQGVCGALILEEACQLYEINSNPRMWCFIQYLFSCVSFSVSIVSWDLPLLFKKPFETHSRQTDVGVFFITIFTFIMQYSRVHCCAEWSLFVCLIFCKAWFPVVYLLSPQNKKLTDGYVRCHVNPCESWGWGGIFNQTDWPLGR